MFYMAILHISDVVCLCSYTSDEIHFNLMAIVSDRKSQYEKEISACESQRDTAARRVSSPESNHVRYWMGSVFITMINKC